MAEQVVPGIEDVVDVEACAKAGKSPGNGRRFRIRIDDDPYVVDDPVLTGRQLLNEAKKRPVEEHLVYWVTPDGLLEDIGLDETVDLRQPGIERFLTFLADRSFRFELDGKRQDWPPSKISEAMLRKIAGVGPEYRVWQERRGEEDHQLERGEFVDLTAEGIERFYTGRDDTTAGSVACCLPIPDVRYLGEKGIEWEDVEHGNQRGIVLKGYSLPAGHFGVDTSDVLVVLPSNYPDVAPDMFFTDPWLRLRETGQNPPQADQRFSFAGREWQRWSRHNKDWKSGDGIHTMLRRIDRALRGE